MVFLLSMLAQGANGEAAYTVDKVATRLAERQSLHFGGADKVTFLWLPAEHSPAWCKEGGCLLPCHAPSLPPSWISGWMQGDVPLKCASQWTKATGRGETGFDLRVEPSASHVMKGGHLLSADLAHLLPRSSARPFVWEQEPSTAT